jgi:hypothetical protein
MAQEIVQKRVITPLLGDRGPYLRREEIAAQRPAPSPSAANEARKNAAAQLATRKLEPDEIHIQIGRIEVTAVEQAPVRASRKPAFQGESLTEYLKRPARRA